VRALVFDGEKASVRDDVEVRPPGPTDVRVRIVSAGLCHSDVSVLDGTIQWPSPSVMGHEGAGIVDAVGEAVTHVKPGDHVVVHTMAYCGACKWCITGHPAWCRKSIANASQPFTVGGVPAWNFAAASFFSEYTVVRGVQCVKIPDEIPLGVACLIGCGVLTGIGSVWNRTNLGLGHKAAVFGVGGVGLNVIQAARAKGASRIVAIDTLPEKEQAARDFGATDFILAGPGVDTVAKVREMFPTEIDNVVGSFGEGGVDYAFECVGHPALVQQAFDILDWGGTLVAVGVPSSTAMAELKITAFTQVERTVTGSRAGSHRPHYDIPLIVDAYQRGVIKLDELVSATYPLEDWESCVHDLHEGKLLRGVLNVTEA
jgi:S-(hydroxymethyl)glutathione dehydrogenase/alcohol dehydrogenase